MILQDEYWFDVVPSRRDSGTTIAGKWLHFGPTEELHSWLERLDRLVEGGQIVSAKVARKLPDHDPFPNKPCVLGVFTPAHKHSKERAQQILKSEFGIDVTYWKSDEQTERDWEPGGWLQAEAEVNRLRRRLEREGVGEGERSRLRRLAEHFQQIVERVEEPSRIAEIEASRTVVRQLAEDISRPEVSSQSIVARLDDIQRQLSQLMPSKQSAAHQAVLPVTEDAEAVFVIMPFAKKHIDTYRAIRRGVREASATLRAHRVDEAPGAIRITDAMHKSILEAWLIVCDLTEERPNVYYELGLAHGLAKRIVCIAREGTSIHFDVYGLKILFFEDYGSLASKLKQEIRSLLQIAGRKPKMRSR